VVPVSAAAMFRQGVLVNLTNPKAVVFFLAFTPQFIRPARPLLSQYAVLAATVVAVDVLVMWGVFAVAARGLRRLTRTQQGQRRLNRLFGGLFVGVGLLLASVH
jgi:homoserine/homoserine lactone efflux protein